MNIYVNNFNISILDNSNCNLFSNKGELVLKILSDTGLFSWNPTVILADPFLFVHNGVLFLFYERQDRWLGKGRICMRKTNDLSIWSEEKEVLGEPFHLSFPFVFREKDGHVYMIPETGQSCSVRLYESTDDSLEHWKLNSILLDGSEWVDSSVIKNENRYFLFTSKMVGDVLEQHLFFANRLEGPYKMHPQSPIHIGNEFGRNAGSVFRVCNDLYRPTQKCVGSYGENVSIFKIEELTESKYVESLFKHNILDKAGFFMNGGHQFNWVEFKGKTIVATDFRTRNYNIIEFSRRIGKHLFHHK